MSTTRITVAVLGAMLLGLAASPALAANAVVTQDSVVREDPDGSADVVNEVSEGDEVTVTDCEGSYCFIKIPGPDGWIRQNRLGSLDEDGEGPGGAPFSFSFGVGPDGKPSFSVGIGTKPPPVIVDPVACFYKGANYTGSKLCIEAGDNRDTLGGFNDSISSIKISGGAEATVCRNTFMAGLCSTVTSSKPTLSVTYNDKISSLEVN